MDWVDDPALLLLGFSRKVFSVWLGRVCCSVWDSVSSMQTICLFFASLFLRDIVLYRLWHYEYDRCLCRSSCDSFIGGGGLIKEILGGFAMLAAGVLCAVVIRLYFLRA